MSVDVYVIRHGNTFDRGDTILRVGGRTDLPLSVSGLEQARALGAHFREKSVEFARILAGPLRRTRETAQAIADAQSREVEIEIVENLREIDYGPDEGKPEDDVVARLGQDAIDSWESHSAVPDGWIVDPSALEAAWLTLFENLRSAEGPVAVVTSNGVARFVPSALGETTMQSAKLKTGAFGLIRLHEEGDTVARWNERP